MVLNERRLFDKTEACYKISPSFHLSAVDLHVEEEGRGAAEEAAEWSDGGQRRRAEPDHPCHG